MITDCVSKFKNQIKNRLDFDLINK